MKTPQDGGAAVAGGDQEDASISAAPQQGGAASIRCLVSSTFNIRLSTFKTTAHLRFGEGVSGYSGLPNSLEKAWPHESSRNGLLFFITRFSFSLRDDLQVRSMPGVVIVESLGQGHILLHAAPDKSTRHIADLVSKQFDPYRYFVSHDFWSYCWI